VRDEHWGMMLAVDLAYAGARRRRHEFASCRWMTVSVTCSTSFAAGYVAGRCSRTAGVRRQSSRRDRRFRV
jgi:hypothetical protein